MDSNLQMPEPSIEVHVLQKLLFLHPPASTETPAHDPLLCGEVVLTLPKVTSVKSLSVKLIGSYELALPEGAWKRGKTLEKELILDEFVGGKFLEKGIHKFAFTIVVPSSTAPFERCKYGRIYHTMSCFSKLGGGVVGLGTTLHDEIGVEFVVNPAGEGELMPCNVRVERFNDEMGPYSVDFESQHLTIGGLLEFSAHFPSLPRKLYIDSLEVYLAQSYQVNGSSVPWHKHQIFKFEPKTHPHLPAKLDEGESFSLAHSARIPDHHRVRSTTIPGTKSPISVNHDIILEITFRYDREGSGKKTAPTGVKVFKVKSPVTISSCRVMPASLTLPSYSSKSVTLEPGSEAPICMCGFTMEGLVKQRGEGLGKVETPTETRPVSKKFRCSV